MPIVWSGAEGDRVAPEGFADAKDPPMIGEGALGLHLLQETFVDDHEDLLFDDLAAFNRQLADWPLAYNTALPHHSLDRQSPVQFLLQRQPECQRWWTQTCTCFSYVIHGKEFAETIHRSVATVEGHRLGAHHGEGRSDDDREHAGNGSGGWGEARQWGLDKQAGC